MSEKGAHDGHRERLRGKFAENGIDGMYEHEVLELLLSYAIPRQDTNALAHALIDRFGSLTDVLSANVYDIANTPGLGMRSATLVKLAGEIRRVGMTKDEKRVIRLRNPYELASYCRTLYREQRYESLNVISLDKRYTVIHADEVGTGDVTGAPVDARKVCECLIRHGAYAAILTHNHPSGDVRPSRTDGRTTVAVAALLENINVKFYDHIIVGKDEAFSIKTTLTMDLNDLSDLKLNVAELRY